MLMAELGKLGGNHQSVAADLPPNRSYQLEGTATVVGIIENQVNPFTVE
jgi:hypothetical protein